MISVKDLHKSFGGVTVLDGISTDIEKGDVVCICLLYTSDAADE